LIPDAICALQQADTGGQKLHLLLTISPSALEKNAAGAFLAVARQSDFA
jgi:hypothetical protein